MTNLKTKKTVRQVGGMIGIETSDLDKWDIEVNDTVDQSKELPDFKNVCSQNKMKD